MDGGKTGTPARHPGPADPEGRLARPVARVRDLAADPADFKRTAGDSAGITLPGAVPSGASGLDCERVGRVGEQTQGQVLPPDCGGKAPTARRSRKMEADGGRDGGHPGHQAGGNMTGWARFRSWLRATLERARMEREMDAEFRFHIEKHAEELMRGGLPREEAQRRARIEFGGIDATKEACREARGAGLVESFAHDMSYGLRMLRKNPGFASLAVMTLALGIGATTAMFSLVNAALLRALPYREPERLVYVWEPNPHIPGVPLEAWGPFNGDFYDWKKQSQSFTRLALFTTDRMNLSVAGEAARVCGSRVTGEFFQVLGISPELGRAVE